jgi:monofunctional glycosyltransferase
MATKAKKSTSLVSRMWRWTKRVFLFLLISHLVYVVLLKWVNPPFTSTMVRSSLHCLTSKDVNFKRDYIDYKAMGTNAKLAVLSAEDQLFPSHKGFDFDAIQKAIEYNEKNDGKKVRGASTISQQLAKNVFLWQGRDYIRKGLEAYFTVLIELVWGKKRILEMYLNVAEMGDGIFGIEAAAQHYFKKPAAQLSKSEAAWIASVLPNPVLYKVKDPNNKIVKKHDRLIQYMYALSNDKQIIELIH